MRDTDMKNSVSRTAQLVLLCTLLVAACSSSGTPSAGTAVSPAAGSVPGVGQSGINPPTGSQVAPAPAGTPGALSASELVTQLRDSGLPVTPTIVYTTTTDSEHLLGRPGGYISKAAFVDGRVSRDGLPDTSAGSVWLGGSVEVFRTPADAQQRQRFLTSQGSDPAKIEYTYVRGPVLLRVSHKLDVSYADGYGKILQRTG
ncbi:hypothetical protein [Frankia sp. Cppng1_Ct_nod]|uniref:hypothetical protein n=1 Tax=Frankia sp. Cppng1_Ct_nod TaxID=2897162 RepID=UPI0013EF90B3|nr:hypothetical protein [Frankia sp. Cppng1_Ct_nod]